MHNLCTICNNTNRLSIDKDLVSGKSYRRVAMEYGVNPQALRRHKNNHLSRQLVQAYEKKGLVESMDLLGRIDKNITRAEKIFQRNIEKNTAAGDKTALNALREQRSTIELLGNTSAFLYEYRLLELQNSQERFEQESEAEYQAKLKLLTDEELDMLIYLQYKMLGKAEEAPFPSVLKTTAREDIPQAPDPTPDPTPKPAPKPPAPEPEPANAPVPPAPVPQKPASKTLPPAPSVQIPGGSRSAINVARHKLARKAFSRPVEKTVNNSGGMWFPGEKE